MFFRNRREKTQAASSDSLLLVGLGNVGERYTYTRHNAGFILVDEIANKYGLRWKKSRHEADVTDVIIGGKKVILAKPTTLMNNSGRSVSALKNYYKLDYSQIFIAYDDVDIKLGKIRMRTGGSSGRHNGIKSIIQHLKTEEFARLRIGIGPKPERFDMVNFVLGGFTPSEQELLEDAIDMGVGAIETWAKEGLEMAMTKYSNR